MVSQADNSISDVAARIAELLPAYRARWEGKGGLAWQTVTDAEAWLAGKPTVQQGSREAAGEAIVIWLMAFGSPATPADNPPQKA